jgi:hypothetical protein
LRQLRLLEVIKSFGPRGATEKQIRLRLARTNGQPRRRENGGDGHR